MKKIILALLLLPLLGRAQAHLGMSEYRIKAEHPDETFHSDVTTKGTKFIFANMPFGVFYYYFDNEGYSDYNMQIPYTMKDVNDQTQIYNGKYVILTDHSWKAYVENGGVIYITLEYNTDTKLWIFSYADY